jgi:hypothetical protein
MRTWAVGLFGALVLVVSTSKATACSCACDASVTVDDYIDQASVIVVGRVVALRPGPPPNNGDPLTKQFAEVTGSNPEDLVVISSCSDRTVEVAVEQVLKGEARTELSFAQRAVGTPCDFGFPLRVGGAYLLFGFRADDGRAVSLPGCSPSLPARKAKKMIARVRKRIAAAS